MIQIRNLSLDLGGKEILENLSITFEQHQKIGIVGPNGAGKSTLLKLISGSMKADKGTIAIGRDTKLAYLPQDITLSSTKPVLEQVVASANPDAAKILDELAALDQKLHEQATATDQHLLERYAELQGHLVEHQVDSLRSSGERILTGLGFNEKQLAQHVNQLSVGWKMRLMLGALLLKNADMYLFDEPSNHLDIVAKDWFMKFLQDAQFGFLLVSHDRYFLDHICDFIFELECGQGKLYRGNYTAYREQKAHDRDLLQKAYDSQQRELKEKAKTIERFKAKASKAGMAKSMMKQLEKVEKISLPPGPPTISMSFRPVARAGDVVLRAHDLSKVFDGQTIFSHASLELKRGEKAGLIAANGKGKSTLLQLIAGRYPLESGTVTFGHNVDYAYFEQDQGQALNQKKTILEEVEDSCTTSEARTRVRAMLGMFLFSGDTVYKKIGVLSGGEKNRVAMVKVLLQNANFLILDEPTNHLDLASNEVLQRALIAYPGTILFVSHDRDFLNNLATHIFALTPTGIVSYPGNYDSYCYAQEQLAASQATQTSRNSAAKKSSYKNEPVESTDPDPRKQEKKLEQKVDRLERELARLYEQLGSADYGSTAYHEFLDRVDQTKDALKEATQAWEELQKAP